MSYSLCVYWGPRHESVEGCAERLLRFFREIATFEAALAAWCVTGRARNPTMEKRINIGNRDELVCLLNRGRNRNERTREVIEKFGFGVHFWNGFDNGVTATLRLHCGDFDEMGGNEVILSFREGLGRLADWEVMAGLLSTTIKVWDADEVGFVDSETLIPDPSSSTGRNWRYYNWMLYYSRAERVHFPALPPPARIVPVDSIGTIIMTQNEIPDPANAAHVANVERVKAALRPSDDEAARERSNWELLWREPLGAAFMSRPPRCEGPGNGTSHIDKDQSSDDDEHMSEDEIIARLAEMGLEVEKSDDCG
jgi:hypothetical protein